MLGFHVTDATEKSDLVLQWIDDDDPVEIDKDIELPQFDLIEIRPSKCDDKTYKTGTVFNPWTAGVSGWISDSYCSIKPLWSGMGEVVPARTSPPLHPPSPPTVLWLPCLQVSQCINCCH